MSQCGQEACKMAIKLCTVVTVGQTQTLDLLETKKGRSLVYVVLLS